MMRMLMAVVLMTCASLAAAQTIQLITEDEAKLPAAPQVSARAITRGPGVKLVSPEAVGKSSFAFKVAFAPRGSSKIDPASVQVVYLKNPQVDLTTRVKAGIGPVGIDVIAASAPAGEHPIRVSVRDDEGRQGTATFNLVVK
ncbi:MAG: hypothetical protein AABZ67_16245 [Pseudomonadota bacterium]